MQFEGEIYEIGLEWIGLENQMEPLNFQSIFKIVMVTQSIPGLVGLIGLISSRLDWLLIRWLYRRT